MRALHKKAWVLSLQLYRGRTSFITLFLMYPLFMIVSQSADVVQNSFTGLWYTVAQYLPAILAAIIVFIIGWIVGVILYRIVVEVVKVLRIDDALKAAGLNDAAKEAGFTLDIGRFLGTF